MANCPKRKLKHSENVGVHQISYLNRFYGLLVVHQENWQKIFFRSNSPSQRTCPMDWWKYCKLESYQRHQRWCTRRQLRKDNATSNLFHFWLFVKKVLGKWPYHCKWGTITDTDLLILTELNWVFWGWQKSIQKVHALSWACSLLTWKENQHFNLYKKFAWSKSNPSCSADIFLEYFFDFCRRCQKASKIAKYPRPEIWVAQSNRLELWI